MPHRPLLRLLRVYPLRLLRSHPLPNLLPLVSQKSNDPNLSPPRDLRQTLRLHLRLVPYTHKRAKKLFTDSLLAQTNDQVQRDPGVDDATWTQLQADKAAAEAAEKNAAEELRKRNIAQQNALNELRAAEAAARKLAQKVAKDNSVNEELRRQREAARIRELEAKSAREKALAALREKQQEENRRKREEAKVQQKLRHMGVCVAGFRWIKQSGGYRCGGGSHCVSNAQLGI